MISSLIYSLMIVLLRLALKIMPPNRREWGRAMLYETLHQTSEFQALLWALGCLKTAMLERIRMMKTGTLCVSKTVLALEIVCCFLPVSFMLIGLLNELLMLRILDREILFFAYSTLTFYLIGPIGVVLGLRYLLKGPIRIGFFVKTLLSLLAIGTVIAPIWFMQFTAGNVRFDNAWLVVSLIGVLPALAISHLIYLSKDNSKLAHS